MIKRQHGLGWKIREQSGRVKLTRRWPDGGESSVMLDLPWDSSSSTAVLSQLEAIRGRMEEAGLSLAEAARLQAEAKASSRQGGNYVTTEDALDWEAVVERFHAHKTRHTGALQERT
ncbi:MAG: hypothetical protein VKK62_11640 [Synechococcaceae cyanobacterium]|nr:hypothetical protein [Synechococcaceae cyanobacterium]